MLTPVTPKFSFAASAPYQCACGEKQKRVEKTLAGMTSISPAPTKATMMHMPTSYKAPTPRKTARIEY